MSDKLSSHDHGNCALCDQIETENEALRASEAALRDKLAALTIRRVPVSDTIEPPSRESELQKCVDELVAATDAEAVEFHRRPLNMAAHTHSLQRVETAWATARRLASKGEGS